MFVSTAYAQGFGGEAGGGLLGMMLPLVMIMGVFWFLLIRPQQKRAKEHQELISNVRRGDTIVTSGGIVGKVAKVIDENEIDVDVADSVRMRFQKQAITQVRVKGEPAKDTAKSSAKKK